MTFRPDRPLAAAVLAIGVAAVLSVAADDDDPASAQSGSSATVSPTPSVTTPATRGGATAKAAPTYADGTYEASGSYQSPAGKESVSVSLTVADDRVTAVTVTPGATGGPSKQFQDEFVGGVEGVVVGRPLATLAVDVVAGSSLTGKGFDQAVERIRKEATS
jgi:uncharacterized protein with FMN-binding domain